MFQEAKTISEYVVTLSKRIKKILVDGNLEVKELEDFVSKNLDHMEYFCDYGENIPIEIKEECISELIKIY